MGPDVLPSPAPSTLCGIADCLPAMLDKVRSLGLWQRDRGTPSRSPSRSSHALNSLVTCGPRNGVHAGTAHATVHGNSGTSVLTCATERTPIAHSVELSWVQLDEPGVSALALSPP